MPPLRPYEARKLYKQKLSKLNLKDFRPHVLLYILVILSLNYAAALDGVGFRVLGLGELKLLNLLARYPVLF